jgi:hypothetical protein
LDDEHYNAVFDVKTPGQSLGRKHHIKPDVKIYDAKEDGMTYDVVKKRKIVHSVNAAVGADVTDALLGEDGAKYLYDFSDAVLQALTALTIHEARLAEAEKQWMERDEQCIAGTRYGYVYACHNLMLGPPIKLGATMKDSPFPRLKELSSCLPQSFELLACVRSTNPFALEKRVHAHFAAHRIKRASTNRNSEFFMASQDDVCEFFAKLNQEPNP